MGDMVPREGPSGRHGPVAPESLFATWRALLSRLFWGTERLIRSAASALVAGMRELGGTVASARAGSDSARDRVAIAAAGAVVLAHAGLSVLFAAPDSRFQALAAASIASLWVLARLPVMRVVAERFTDIDRHRVTLAWSAGALLHLVALSPGLRVLAWAGGAALTYRALRLSGTGARDARVIAGWGYGLEACGFVLVSLGRSLAIAALWLGGAPG